MKKEYPINLYGYYQDDKANFESRSNKSKKAIYGILLAVFVFLMIMPSVIPVSSILIRIVAGVGILICGLLFFYGGSDFYSKKSGGKIESIAIKKFDCNATSELELASMFATNNFAGLAKAFDADNQPVQLYVHEDAVGKVFYLQLMKYYSQSDFSGMSEVKVISEPQYSEVYRDIKNIKST